MRMPLLAGAIVGVVAAMVPIGVASATSPTGMIKVLSAGSPVSNPGLLSVNIESTTPVVPSSISVQLISQRTSSENATVNDFTLTAGINKGGTTTTWTVPSPLTQAELTLGRYTIEVQAADTGGDTTTNTNAGTLSFIVYPTLTLSVSPPSFSYGQTVTLSGTETGVYPDGTTQPVPGQIIEGFGVLATTNSAGQYSINVVAGVGDAIDMDQPNGINIFAPLSWIAPFTYSNTVSVSVVPVRIKFSGLTTKPSPVPFTYGGGFSIGATASYPIDGSSLPLADSDIEVSAIGTQDKATFRYLPISDTTTDDFGSFSATIDGPVSTTNYQFAVTGTFAGTSWFEIPLTLKIPVTGHPLLLSSFSPVVKRFGRIRFHACVNVVSPWAGPDFNTQWIDPAEIALPKAKVQYAAKENGPWTTVRGAAAIAPFHLAGSPFVRRCYVTTTRRPAHSAWFRFVVPADTAWAGLQSLPTKPEG